METIKFSPYASSKWTAYGPQPDNGPQYKAPDGTLWHADRTEGNTVQLWTVNAYGQTHWQAVNVYEFRQTWNEVL